MRHEIKQEVRDVMSLYKLTIDSEFIPWSQSRKAKEKTPSLNWKVTLKQDGRHIVTTLYTAGIAHCPSYQQRETLYSREQTRIECEKGFQTYGSMGMLNKYLPITPNPADVIYSLMLDSDVGNYGEFEDWAADFGYDPDSREAEKIWNACLKIAIQFNTNLSSVVRDALREAFQDY